MSFPSRVVSHSTRLLWCRMTRAASGRSCKRLEVLNVTVLFLRAIRAGFPGVVGIGRFSRGQSADAGFPAAPHAQRRAAQTLAASRGGGDAGGLCLRAAAVAGVLLNIVTGGGKTAAIGAVIAWLKIVP